VTRKLLQIINYNLRLILCLLIISSFAFGQENRISKKKISFRKKLRATTKTQINTLKNGALLVCLKTRKPNIEALRKVGRHAQADKLENKQMLLNKNIMLAFKAKFSFCPTYFFFSDYLIYVKEGNFEQVVFLKENLKPDSSIKFVYQSYMVAEFGKIQQDTAKYISHYTYEPDKHFSLTQVKHYYGGPNMGFDALIISSDKLIQLRRPFPYYVRTRDPLPRNRVVIHAVKKMNKKLNRFYLKKNRAQ